MRLRSRNSSAQVISFLRIAIRSMAGFRFGQRLRFRGEDEKYGWWNHAAVIVSTDGDLIEALNAGVTRTNITA